MRLPETISPPAPVRTALRMATVLLVLSVLSVRVFAQASLQRGVRISNANGNIITILSGTNPLNYTLLLPPTSNPSTTSASLLYGIGSGQLGWTNTGGVATGNILTLQLSGSDLVPTWSDPASVLSGNYWALTGNAVTAAYNGTTGSFIGTTDTQPLVVATTNTTTPQPIEFYTNNTEVMRLTSGGELGIGLTPTAGRLLHVAGTAGTADVRLNSLSGSNLFTAVGTNDGLVFADANGDLTKRDISLLNIPLANSFVKYDVTSAQSTSATRSDNLFNVSYGASASDVNAAGAVITSVAGATNRTATGLTLTATATGTGTATGLNVTASGGATNTAIASTGNINLLSAGGSASSLSFQDPAGTHTTSFLAGAQTANLSYTWPTSAPAANQVLISNGGNSSALSWVDASSFLNGSYWGLNGNSITAAYNGTTGNFVGTTNTQPLVVATTNTSTAQPIEFLTANTERVRINAAGELGVGTTATSGRLLHIGGSSGDLNIRFNALSGADGATALASTDGFVIADANGDLTKRTYTTLVTPLSGYFVNYDVTSPQSLSLTRTDNLFNVAYSGTANDANAAGAVITSVGGASNRSATGLTVTSTATGSGASTGLSITASGGTTNTSIAATGDVNLLSSGGTASQLSLQNPAGTFASAFVSGAQTANLSYTLPITAPTANQVLISSGGATSSLSWADASTLLSGNYWSLTGNSITAGYNGTTGNFLGTTNTQPLVIATTNTTTPQPIEFYTNNTEVMRLTSGGELGIGLTPTSGRLLHVAGTAGTADVRMNSLSGANLFTAVSTNDGLVFADANGDLTKRDISLLNIPLANSFVKYDVTSTQNAAVTRTDNLFDVSYGAGANDANASGAVITSAGGATNRSATGLTVTSTATGTGTSTGLSVSASGGATNTAIAATGNVSLLSNGGTASQLSLQNPAGTFATSFIAGAQTSNVSYTLPTATPTSNQVLISSGGANSLLSWADASTLLTGNYWGLTGNSIAGAYNGTTGNFLGTTNTQPLVIATTNTSVPQPIEFFTNNAETMRLTSAGELGIGLTPTSGRLLHVAGTAGTADVRMNSLSGANLFTAVSTNDGLVFADANGDLTKRDISLLNIPLANSFVKYDVTSTQNASVTRTDNLFNVSYGAGGNDANAAGAVITSAGGATNRSATGLTVTSTATGTGTSTGLSVSATGGASNTAIAATGNVNLLSNSGTASQLSLQNPAGTFTSAFTSGAQTANLSYTLPITAPTANQVLISSGGGTSSLSWADASTLLSGNYWGLTGNSITGAYNGTTGNFLGTTNTQPLVIATTNTTTAQPIEFYTNNVEVMRLTSAGELGIGLTPTSGRLLHVAGTAGTADVRMNSLSGANLFTAVGTNDGLVFADANGDLTKRDISLLNIPLASSFVKYDVTSTQNASVTRTDNLFNVSYGAGANDANAAGAVITSAGGATNRSASGLTVTSTATGTGTATGLTVSATGGTTNYAALFTGSVGIGTTTPTQGFELKNANALLSNNTGTASQLQFQGTGTGITAFKAGAQGSTNITYTLPTSLPLSTGYVLTSTTTGTLSWVAGGGTVTGTGTATRVAFWGPGPGVTSQLMDDANLYWDNNNKRLSVGSGTTPNTAIDVSKDLATREYNYLTSVSGTLNDVNFDGLSNQTSFVRIATATGAYTITGLAGGANGKNLRVYNATTQTMSIANQSASSTAANRIITGTGTTVLVPAGGSINMIYSATDSRWIAYSSSNGNDAWITGGNTGLVDNSTNLLGTLDNTNVRFVTGSGGPNTRMVLDQSGNLILGRNSGTTSFSSGVGRFALGDSLSTSRLNSVPTYTNSTLNLIDPNATLRVWRFNSNAGSTDPAIDLVGGTNDNQSNSANQWWTLSSTGTPGNSTSGTNGTGEHLAIRRRSGGTDSEYVSVFSGGNVGIGGDGTGVVTAAPNRLTVLQTDTITSSAPNVLALEHNSSSTPAAKFGAGLVFRGKSTSTNNRDMAQLNSAWTTATDASRTADLVISTVKNGTTTEHVRVSGTGYVGVNNAVPGVSMDINGGYAAHGKNDTLTSSATNNDIPIGDASFIRILGPTGPFSISGMQAGVNGQHVRLANMTGYDMTILDSSSLSSAGNRIETNTNSDVIVKGPVPILDMTYDSVTAQWLLGTLNANQIIGGVGSIIYATKANSTTRLNTAAVANDPDLTLSLPAGQSWELNGELDAGNPANNIDIKMGWTIPTGATMKVMYTGIQDAGGNAIQGNGQWTASGQTKTIQINAAVSTLISVRGIITTSGSNSGSVTLQWAQGTANGTNATTLNAGSYIKIIRVK